VKLKVFCLQDIKAGFFMQPFMFPSTGQAVRAIMDLCSEPQTTIARHPADFILWQIAEWDDSNALYLPLPQYESLGSCVALLPKANAPQELFAE